MTLRLKNETEEEIVIPPGESVDIKALKNSSKATVSKLTKYRIQEVTPASAGTREE